MKIGKTLALALAAVFALSLAAIRADDKKEDPKEVTLKGTITCAKCDLGLATECANVIKVKEKDKDTDKDVTVVYWLKDNGNGEKYHEKVCNSPAKGSVTGIVKVDKDGKKWITPSKDGVKYD
jgi:uncharacterized membrane protein